MRRALAVVLLAGAVAAPASATEVTIVPGMQIGKVRLGMTFAQVKKVLGQPQTVNARAQVSRRRGYIEYGWDFSTFWVGFINTKGVLHAALIGTDVRGQKTKDAVGWGTPIAKLRAHYHVACNTFPGGEIDYRKWYSDPGENVYSYCLLGPRDAPTTIFGLKCAVDKYPCPALVVNRVIVRTSF